MDIEAIIHDMTCSIKSSLPRSVHCRKKHSPLSSVHCDLPRGIIGILPCSIECSIKRSINFNKAIASRVRGAVAGEKFDEFHRNSARIIRTAVFGTDDEGHIRDEFRIRTNNLVITNIDIQSVESVDERTLESLQKSVSGANRDSNHHRCPRSSGKTRCITDRTSCESQTRMPGNC